MGVLIACESSGTVREAFRANGHDAWSCDLLPADDDSEYHYQGDGIQVIRDNQWDLIICHPPCTHLAVSGAAHQIIQPWMFGHKEQKATCLWLSKLPPLYATDDVYDAMMELDDKERQRIHYLPPSDDRWKLRSKTYDGVARAMAEQWCIDDYVEQPKDQLSLI